MLIDQHTTGPAPESSDSVWSNRTLRWLLLVLLVALALGLYGRFRGLGRWSLGVDEFYIARSVDNLLRSGVPRFPCGGWYTRGLSYQYLVAAVRLSGMSPEFSGRLISALSSLVGLPAAYLIGRRLGGRVLGILLLIILLVSVWQIEMARFVRMYAPFQSIFLWYLVYFLRYTVDRERTAVWPMVALSVLGALTWEGGALLGITNLLPPLLNHARGRLQPPAGMYLAAMLLLLVGLLAIVGSLPFFSSDVHLLSRRSGAIAAAPGTWRVYREHAVWMGLFLLLPLTLAGASWRWLWSLRNRWLAALGVAVVLVSALLHQFVLCGFACAILLLASLVTPTELGSRPARAYCLALVACALFWLAFGVATNAWHEIVPAGATGSTHRWLGTVQHLAGFPNVFGEILRPWGRTVPALTVGLALLSIALFVKAVGAVREVITSPSEPVATARTLLIVLLVLMLAVGARSPGRIETRYTFFLYPLVLALSLAGLLWLVGAVAGSRQAALGWGAAVALLLFGLSEDFRPLHIATVDSWRTTFRVGENANTADHYYGRSDYRIVAAWLSQHRRPGDAVIIGIQSIAQYYHQANYFFLQDGDPRIDETVCRGGRLERWTNLPLLYRTDALAQKVATGQRIFLVMYPDQAHAMLLEGERRNWRERQDWISPDGGASVMLINPSRAALSIHPHVWPGRFP